MCLTSDLRKMFLAVAIERGILKDVLTAFKYVKEHSKIFHEIFEHIRIELSSRWNRPGWPEYELLYEDTICNIINAILILAQCTKHGLNKVDEVHAIISVIMHLPNIEDRFLAVKNVLPDMIERNEQFNEQTIQMNIQQWIQSDAFKSLTISKKMNEPISAASKPNDVQNCSICLETLDGKIQELDCKVTCTCTLRKIC